MLLTNYLILSLPGLARRIRLQNLYLSANYFLVRAEKCTYFWLTSNSWLSEREYEPLAKKYSWAEYVSMLNKLARYYFMYNRIESYIISRIQAIDNTGL